MSNLPKILAVDFDGTIVRDEFPEIGFPHYEIIDLLKRLHNKGVKIILWTCRTGSRLTEAVEFCDRVGLHLDAVNTNIPEVIAMYHEDTRKVFADVYLDDKAVPVPMDEAYWIHRLGM